MQITTIVDTNIRLTQALIQALIRANVLSRDQVAEMLNAIIQSDQEKNSHNAKEIEGLIKQLFVTE